MKRVLLAVSLVCLMFPAVVYAKVVVCDGGECNGTNEPDQITGSNKHDEIYAKAGNDDVDASNPLIGNCTPPNTCGFIADKDVIHAGSGNDQINVLDHVTQARPTGSTGGGFGSDTVYCGKGEDTVTADKGDELHGCEHVTAT